MAGTFLKSLETLLDEELPVTVLGPSVSLLRPPVQLKTGPCATVLDPLWERLYLPLLPISGTAAFGFRYPLCNLNFRKVISAPVTPHLVEYWLLVPHVQIEYGSPL